MANISGTAQESVFQIKQWFGLNQNPDGDTKLKMGEASEMRNFMVTRDGNLRKRQGSRTKYTIGDKPISGMWTGKVRDDEVVIVTTGNKAYLLYRNAWLAEPEEIGTFANEPENVHIFGFSMDAWFLTGSEYLHWDGTTFEKPVGYRPLVAITLAPSGTNETLEKINRLNGCRRVWLSPDGEGSTFTLPEKNLSSIDGITRFSDNTEITAYTADLAAGTVTFNTVPEKAVNSIEIRYSVPVTFENQVTAMRFAETFNGTQDTRVFLYGDGSNKAIYSGVDHDGQQRADYFPDLFEMKIGDDNTPITALVRHYATLVCFKTSSTYSISFGTIMGEDGISIDAFYSSPVNKTIGNEAFGQAQMILNYPRTLFGSDVYEWKNSATYSSRLTIDERQARRISDRVYSQLREFDIPNCVTFDDNYHQFYYIVDGTDVLVHNYANDTWFYYTGLDMHRMMAINDQMYFGTTDGRIMEFTSEVLYDQNKAGEHKEIDCYWESGSMSFGQDYKRKYSAMTWLGVKPEAHSEVHVTIETDRANIEKEKIVERDLFDFGQIDFGAFDFSTSGKPIMKKLKIKAKKFVYYKLILKLNASDKTTTVTSADFRVRFTGYAK